jgi:pimeloyl-ACP methyl ester carboxylesterase
VTDIADPSIPIVLVHGWGGSFTATWERSGFTALLADAGRPVIGIDLLGHGTAPRPHDPAAYSDLTARIIEALPDGPVDAVGFSLGALTLLRAAVDDSSRFRRLVLAGIGRNVFERDEEATARIIAAIDSGGGTDDDIDDNRARLFAQYAHQPGNDPVALAAIMRGGSNARLAPGDLAAVELPGLIAVGDRDFVLPVDDLVDALPDARSVTLRRTDHFSTPESFDYLAAALEFLDAVPGRRSRPTSNLQSPACGRAGSSRFRPRRCTGWQLTHPAPMPSAGSSQPRAVPTTIP